MPCFDFYTFEVMTNADSGWTGLDSHCNFAVNDSQDTIWVSIYIQLSNCVPKMGKIFLSSREWVTDT